MILTDKILVVDLEATCWNGKIPAGESSEIIEIGISLLDINTGEISENKAILVKPIKSKVSDFCTQLTTITQDLLDREGIPLDEACKFLAKNYQQYTWASYGAYDIKMMLQQCAMRKLKYPLSANHINVKELFCERKGLMKKVGMAGALGILGIPLEGTHHRGVDDAKNIAKILYWCFSEHE